jgi:hypothetical protein
MADVVSKELVKSLALANGLNLPEARIGRVLEQYKTYLRLLERLDSFELDRTAEPATVFSLATEESALVLLQQTKKQHDDKP